MKQALILLALVSRAALAAGAPNLIEQFKQHRSLEEDKAIIDTMSAEEINSLVDEAGRTSLFYSRHLGTTLLLLGGANPNIPDREGRTPAFRAVSRSDDVAYPIMLDLLLLAHADVNARDKDGTSLLARAVHEKNLPAARLLLLLGADPAPTDVRGDRTPLFVAAQQKDTAMTDLLNNFIPGNSAPPSNLAGNRPFHRTLADAVRAARLGEVNAALARGADINARDRDGATVLFHAVAERRAEAVALLLLQGADPNVVKNDGKTALMQCATGCDMASERVLVDLLVAGADVNATAKDGTTALSQAVHCCNNTAAQWMIWRGASLDVHSPDGTLMQGAALRENWPSMIELLKKAGVRDPAKPVAKLEDPALLVAVRTGTFAEVEAELGKGAHADVVNRFDQTALEWAVCYDRFDVVELLLRHGADINHQHRYNGEHILHALAKWKRATGNSPTARMEILIKHGANPNLAMKDGCTPLMVAAREGAPDTTIEYLAKVTADIDARDKQGVTALGLAFQHGHNPAAAVLRQHNARE